MGQFKPPSSLPNPHLFLVGRDSHGIWVVQEQNGLRGGLFVDRKEALKFAMFENGNQPQEIVMIPGVLELEIAVRSGMKRENASEPAYRVRNAQPDQPSPV